MKSWRVLGMVIVLSLMVGSVSADTSTPTASAAAEPYNIEYVSRYSQSDVGRYVAIAHHPTTGRAYISFYDDMNADLIMAQEVTPGTGNCPGNANWKCQVVDNDTLVGKYTSIDVIQVPSDLPQHPAYTKIAISYYHESTKSLRVASYSSYPYPGTWTIHTVDDSTVDTISRGTFTSMKFSKTDYMPIIGYHSSSTITLSGSVRIASWVGSGGGNCGDGTNWQCTTIDTDNNLLYGSHISLDLDYGGSVFLAFYDPIGGSVKLAYYQGFGGSCTNTGYNCVTIDTMHDVGKYISLHAPQSASDVMRLAYYDLTEGYVKLAEYVGSGGNCTSGAYDCYVVDVVGTPPGNYDLAMDVDSQGYPIIAYMDASVDVAPTALNIARPALAYGEDIGNCGDVRDGDLFQYWRCDTIDNGNGYVDEAQFVAVSVSPAGLATIAYSEYYSDDAETYLKVAQQHFMTYIPLINR